ncbi:hypothetical protein EV363DRAFT_717262 [Boletus edulis]|nr:hypothetical protein EV363DRAFT_717262 [Boletus edulis]
MHPYKVMDGPLPFRIHRHHAAFVSAISIAAFLALCRFLVNAMYHKDIHLESVTSSYLSYDSVRWRERTPRLDAAQNKEVDRARMFIREIGEREIVPLLRSIEAEEQGRRLVGFDQRFKDANRLKHKVADQLRWVPGSTPTQVLAAIPDAVRFTLQYQETEYVEGVWKDMERLRDRGLIPVDLHNAWANDQYKGINARWREPTSGLVFEVQFHTEASFRAKELTHKAYEWIRSDAVEETDRAILRAFQRQVNVKVQIPPGAVEIRE